MTTGQMLIRLGVTCLLLSVADLGLCADAKKAAEATAGVNRLEKEMARLRGLIGFTGRSNVVASDVKACPDGHRTLKDVRIFYGTPSFAPEAQKARETAIARFEYWPGGCVVGSDSPTNRVTCTTCGLGLDTEFGFWSGDRQAPSQFSRPFSPAIQRFPIPSTNSLICGPTYHQAIREERIQNESLSYISREKIDEIVKRVDGWFSTEGLNPTKRVQGSLVTGWQTDRLTVHLNHFSDEGATAVSIFISNQRALSP